MTPTIQNGNRLIPLAEVSRRAGPGRTWIYNAIQQGNFPSPVKVGKRSFWVESEINQWIDDQIANRKAA